MVDINLSLFIQMANFLVLLVLLNYVLYRPIRAMLRQRREKVDGLLASSETALQKNEEADAELTQGRMEVNSQGLELKNGLKDEGLNQEKEILAGIHQEMEAEAARMAEQIKDQLGQARESLLARVESFSSQAAQKILGRSF